MLAFAVGMLALRPPYPSAVRWFEAGLRPPVAEPEDRARKAVLVSDLPLVWGEGSAARLFADAPPPPASYRAMRKGAAITPADVLSEDALAGADLLILAQPRALTPVELLVVDEWVRAGGRALLFADPALHWAGELPPHLPRPPRTSLIRPLLSHWGLELLPGEPGFRIMRPSSSAMVRVGVHSPGKLRSRTSDCTISMNGLMADCAIGKGRALVLADADLLRDASWFGPGAQGESRGARIADNGHLVSAAAQMLLDGQDSMSASDVRWMTAVPKRDVPLILAGLAIPLLLACAGIAKRLKTR